MSESQEIRVRTAPSPTGDPHVGTAYVSLFNYTFANSKDGIFILRIEDTDQARSSQESEDAIIEALKWLGLEWNEGPDIGGESGPYRQSERFDIYNEYAGRLLKTGNAYRCFCTPDRLTALRKSQQAQKRPTGYDGLCRGMDHSEVTEKTEDGVPFTVRLKVPVDGETSYEDCIRGKIKFRNPEIDDQILLKSDGYPTYHLANVVDDHLMGISHVIRAEEWITSTPKHVILYRAFGWTPPVFIHLPLLRNKDRSKISKRKNPVSIDWYRKKGYLPEALLNFLALMGWSMGKDREIFSLKQMINEFSWDRVKKSGPVFDLQKLNWINGEYIRSMTSEELTARILAGGYTRAVDISAELLVKIVELVRERMTVLSEFDDMTSFFFAEEPYDADCLVPGKKDLAFTIRTLTELKERLQSVANWETDTLESELQDFCEQMGYKRGEVYMPLRVAVTCRRVSTPLFETMEILGKKQCMKRLNTALEKAGA